MKTHRIRILALLWLLSVVAVWGTPPSIRWRSLPVNANQGSVIYPVAHAQKGSANLTDIKVWYSWDNINWTLVLHDSSPNNNNPYDPNGDFLGGNLGLTQAGTFHVKATVTDADSSTATAYGSTTVYSSSAGVPSQACATAETYNYATSWMNDAAAGKQKCWWTAMQPGGGDCIVYAKPLVSLPAAQLQPSCLAVTQTMSACFLTPR